MKPAIQPTFNDSQLKRLFTMASHASANAFRVLRNAGKARVVSFVRVFLSAWLALCLSTAVYATDPD